MLKGKILAQLKVKYPGVQSAVLELIATKLAVSVKEEAEIDGAITGLENMPISVTEYAELLQKEGDRRVTEAQKKFQSKDEKKDDKKDDSNPGGGGDDPMKQILKKMDDMSKELADFKASKTRETLHEKLVAALKEKKIPTVLAKGRVIESEDQLEGLVTEIEADHVALKQDLANDGFSQQPKPANGQSGPVGEKAIAAEIQAWAKSNQPATAPTPGAGK